MRWRKLRSSHERDTFAGMEPCPKCHCPHQRFSFFLRPPAGTYVALSCMRCGFDGPETGPISFPPDRRDGDRAARLWNEAAGPAAARKIVAFRRAV
jgi:hypothetical protein